MIIECAGTRGSIPCGGVEFSKYGGDTISLRVTADSGDIIIVDAGSGIRSIGNDIIAESQGCTKHSIHLFFTHYHLDHTLGIPFFKPIYCPTQSIEIYGPALEGANSVEEAFQTVMSAPLSPVSYDGSHIKAKISFNTIAENRFEIGSVTVTSFKINHPNHGGLGYKFEENGKSFVFLTDNELQFTHQNGHLRDEFEAFCANADLLFHDAQFTAEEYHKFHGWGHSTIEDVIELGVNANCKEVGLFHFAPERSDSEVDKLYGSLPTSTQTRFFPLVQGTKFTL